MPDYRRVWQPGGVYFFTHVLADRHRNDLLVRHIDALREALSRTRRTHPFVIHGWVVLPDHLHCLLELPADDADYASRWRLLKMLFSRALPDVAQHAPTHRRKGERGIWQRRYWEHLIRDADDYNRHMDYIHVNPLKHGLVERVGDWPYSTFHRLVAQGVYPPDWAGGSESELAYKD